MHLPAHAPASAKDVMEGQTPGVQALHRCYRAALDKIHAKEDLVAQPQLQPKAPQ